MRGCRKGIGATPLPHAPPPASFRLQTIKKRPCRNCRQNSLLLNRGGEIRCRRSDLCRRQSTRDLLPSSRRRDIEQAEPANYPIRVAVHALTCIQLHSRAFPRFHLHTVALVPPHFVTATVTARNRSARRGRRWEGRSDRTSYCGSRTSKSMAASVAAFQLREEPLVAPTVTHAGKTANAGDSGKGACLCCAPTFDATTC
jgi:hypothetical protein